MKDLLFSVFHESKGPIPIYTDIENEDTLQACSRILVSIMTNLEQKESIEGEALLPLIDLNLVIFLHYFHLNIADSREKAFSFIAWVSDLSNRDIIYYNSHLMTELFKNFELDIKKSLSDCSGIFDSLAGIGSRAISLIKEQQNKILNDFFTCSIEDLEKSIPLKLFVNSSCFLKYHNAGNIETLYSNGKMNINIPIFTNKIVGSMLLKNGIDKQGDIILPSFNTGETIFCTFLEQQKNVYFIFITANNKNLIYEWAELIRRRIHDIFDQFTKNNLNVNGDIKKKLKKTFH